MKTATTMSTTRASSATTDSIEGRLGASIDLTSVLFGEVFGGYVVQRFAEDDFDDETGFSFGVNLNWNPTLLTSVGLYR